MVDTHKVFLYVYQKLLTQEIIKLFLIISIQNIFFVEYKKYIFVTKLFFTSQFN